MTNLSPAGQRDHVPSKSSAVRQARWRVRHRDTYLAKKRVAARAWRKAHPGRADSQYKARYPDRQLWSQAKSRARRCGISFEIDHSDVRIPEYCPVLGIPLRASKGAATDNSPTLDRIRNSAGYVKGNVLVVSFRANRLKSNATPEELGRIADFYGPLWQHGEA